MIRKGNFIFAVALVAPVPPSFAQATLVPNHTGEPGDPSQIETARMYPSTADSTHDKRHGGSPSLVPGTRQEADESGPPLAAASPGTSREVTMQQVERWKREAAAITADNSEVGATASVFGIEKRDDKYVRFGAAFAEAKVPDCLHKDGLKRQPPRIGFFVFQGVLALPFVALAKVRGKCV